MSRFYILSFVTYAFLLFGLATLNGLLVALALPPLVYLAFGLLYGPQSINLHVERRIADERVLPGSPVQVEVTVTNRGPLLEEVLLEDLLPEGLEVADGSPRLLASLQTGATVQLVYQVRGQRGAYRFAELQATAYDLLGVFRQRKAFPASGQIFIVPYALRIKHVAIRPRETRVYSGIIPARLGGSGIDFFGVRGYQDNDPLRYVNWRISARYENRLYINEFEQERVADVGIILDARQRSSVRTKNGSLFEHAITAAATLSQSLLADGNRVGLLVYGMYLDWTYPGYGKVQRERIFKSLARAQPGRSLVFDHLENLPTRVFPFHSQVILVSPIQPDDLRTLVRLRARGYQVMVISPDPVAFEVHSLPELPAYTHSAALARIERRLLITRLRHSGIHVINWDVSISFDQAVSHLLVRLPPWYQPRGGRL